MAADCSIRFSITPFNYTRQFYYAIEEGIVRPDGVSVDVVYKHSPQKDQAIVCGDVDATTMSLGKYVISKSISHTDVFPNDPLAVGAGLSYRRGSGLFTTTDSNVTDPADLEGARLGIHDQSGAMTFHKAILDHHFDVDVDAIEWVVDTHQNLSTAFETGRVDVVERVGDWYWNYLDDPEVELLYDLAEGWNQLEGAYPLIHLLVMDRSFCEANPSTVESFLRALGDSRDYRDEHYHDVLTALRDENSDEGNEQSIERLQRITDTATLPVTLDEEAKANVRAWMEYAVEYEVLPETVSDDRLFPQQVDV